MTRSDDVDFFFADLYIHYEHHIVSSYKEKTKETLPPSEICLLVSLLDNVTS